MNSAHVPVGDLVAGRELDALVAEHVWGRCPHRRLQTDALPHCPDCYAAGDGTAIPPFSTDMAAAWEVITALHEGTPGVARLYFSGRRRFYAALAAQCVTSDGARVAWPDALGAFREQMPLFICRAALVAVNFVAPFPSIPAKH